MNRTRFLTSTLASLAVASAITLAAPSAASAADTPRPCGQPATTITHPAVPATYAVEHRWVRTTAAWTETSDWLASAPADDPAAGAWTAFDQRTVTDQPAVPDSTRQEVFVVKDAWDEQVLVTPETVVHHDAVYQDVQVVDTPAWDEKKVLKAAWDEDIIDPASPAPYAYVNKHGVYKFMPTDTWNGGDDPNHDEGWNRDRDADETITVHHEAVTELIHHDATYKTEPELVTPVRDEVVPATYQTVHHDAVTGTRTRTVTVPGSPAVTHDESRYQRVHPQSTAQKWAGIAPGAGWTDSGDTRRGALLEPARPASVETLAPASKPCPHTSVLTPTTDGPTAGGPTTHGLITKAPTLLPADSTTAANPAQASGAPHATVLPNTGNGASTGAAAGGLAALLGGLALMALGRRQRFPMC